MQDYIYCDILFFVITVFSPVYLFFYSSLQYEVNLIKLEGFGLLSRRVGVPFISLLQPVLLSTMCRLKIPKHYIKRQQQLRVSFPPLFHSGM